MPRWLAVLSVTMGLALLVGTPGYLLVTDEPTVGEVPPAAAEPEAGPDDAERDVDPLRGERPAAGRQAADTEPVDAADVPEVGEPGEVVIDAIGVEAPVVPVGLEDDGGMEIPENVHEIGWYEPGVAPGEQGSAVLAGHVDSRTQGRGAFFDLGELDVDDEVVTTDEDGDEQRWRVTGRTSYPKDELPIDDIFAWGGDEQRLALITCGGDFDDHTRHYTENIVVYTEPVDG